MDYLSPLFPQISHQLHSPFAENDLTELSIASSICLVLSDRLAQAFLGRVLQGDGLQKWASVISKHLALLWSVHASPDWLPNF